MDDIAKMLQEIISQLQLLSLNAMIEASRGIESGASFMVVAHEIKKLSEIANRQLQDIKAIVKDVSGLLERVDFRMDSVLNLTALQSQSTVDITLGIRQVADDVETLRRLADKL